MSLTPEACYRALLARDARHDGRFFVCVKTTGIYCRPICPARPPRPNNCHFVPSAAAAQASGYRPCLRCRPESSPDLAAFGGSSASVSRALSLIEAGALDAAGVGELAERLGVGERHLRRLFKQHLGATPIAVAQTRRVLLAKQLLHDTDLPMTQVALASGFGSLRRFNETFKQLYGRPPRELRGRRTASALPSAAIDLRLPYRPPYDFAAMLEFLAVRALPGVEQVSEGRYARVIALDGATGSLVVEDDPGRSALSVRIRFPHLSKLPALLARVRRLFDLSADPRAIGRVLRRDPLLAPAVRARPGLRVPGAWDGFEIGVRAILGQQITVAAATRLAGRLVAAFGQPVAQPEGALTHAFPSPDTPGLDERAIAALGMPRARARAIAGLAAAAAQDPRLFDPRGELSDAVSRLCALPGIGEWTAQYIAMRVLGQSDAFLVGDVAVRRAFANASAMREPGATDQRELPTPRALLAHAERWQPWRAYAVLHLWTTYAMSEAAQTRAARSNSLPSTRTTHQKRSRSHVATTGPHSVSPV